MSDIPDAISTQQLLSMLNPSMPAATKLPSVAFGTPELHHGNFDLYLLFVMAEALSPRRPAPIQVLYAVGGLLNSIVTHLSEGLIPQLQQLEDTERAAGLALGRDSIAFKRIEFQVLATREHMIDQERIAREAQGLITALQHNWQDTQSTYESIHGEADFPAQGDRQRFVSDAFLDSVGVERSAFDAYFDRQVSLDS